MGRYQICEELGRGGMAVVYRVHDPVSDRFLACKQLLVNNDLRMAAELSQRFEREFHTLSELSHPRIIEVYDYALDASGPFYTMELLDGGDLVEQSPLAWPKACALFHDVCSSLALLHSRRLVHCDISPRNVRCTKDGRAKLIDFGAMVPMGRGTMIVGTPSFTAPEVIARSNLDARTDLFSLGAVLYYALTGRSAFPARDFLELVECWRVKPRPPSHFVPAIPEALDRLALSLLRLDAGDRPRNAFEVMQRLAVIAGLPQAETQAVSRAYLSAPVLVGRAPLMAGLRDELDQALDGHGRTLIVHGAAGLGRSRVLDACVIAAKLRGVCVVRGHADGASGRSFAVAQALCDQLLQNLPENARAAAAAAGVAELLFEPSGDADRPELRDLGKPELERAGLQEALSRWLLEFAAHQPVAIAVDDVERIDEPSAALLAQCAAQSDGRRLLLLLTMKSETAGPRSHVLDVLARHARALPLSPLSEAETISLLTSVFGDVPHVGVVGHGIHALAGGNPGLSMELARHLVDSGCVRYADGNWTLPASLGPNDLPESADSALRARVSALSASARQLLEAQALASHEAFTREDYSQLSPDVPVQRVDQALSELIARGFLVSDGRVYWLAHRSWSSVLTAHMRDSEQRDRHAAIAELYADSLKAVFHWFAAGEPERGLNLLSAQFKALGDTTDIFATLHIPAWELARLFERALAAAHALRRPAREIYELQRWLAAIGVAADDADYWQAAPAWLERLRLDSGLLDWERLAHVTDPGARLTQALQTAFARYTDTPEAERVLRPDEAIRHLVHYVAVSIAVGFRSYDTRLVATLPGLLEPFAPLSAAVAAIHQNACASVLLRCLAQTERARARWLEVYEKLSKLTTAELPYVDVIQRAIASGLGMTEAHVGLPNADRWADLIETDPMQAVQACYLRKIVCLQQGDWDGAETFRRRAEQLSLQSRVRPMFTSTLLIELYAHARAGDLTGVKELKERIAALAAHGQHWKACEFLANAFYQRLCGQLEDACHSFETCIGRSEPDPSDPSRVIPIWAPAVAGYIETLIEAGQYERAKAVGTRMLERCAEREIVLPSFDVRRALALAEAKLGDFEAAFARLDALIEAQEQMGTTGLNVGASYEARARIAIWAKDEPAFDRDERLTARHYRRGVGSPLGACYERLMNEARTAFPHRLVDGSEQGLLGSDRSQSERHTAVSRLVTHVLRQATTPLERATFALSLLCEERGAREGYLYLITDRGLVLVTSQHAAEPSAELSELARTFLSQQLEQLEAQTQFESDVQSVVADIPPAETIAQSALEPVALTCSWQGGLNFVGVALLVRGPASQHNSDAYLASAVGSQLLEAGDTRACTSLDLAR